MRIIEQLIGQNNIAIGKVPAGTIVRYHDSYCIVTDECIIVDLSDGMVMHIESDNICTIVQAELKVYTDEIIMGV